MTAPSGPGDSSEQPSTVRTAFVVWVGALGLYLVGQILAVLFPPSAADYATYVASLHLPPAQQAQVLRTVSSLSGGAALFGLIVTALIVIPGVWIGLRMRAGVGWARIVTLVGAGLGILNGLGSGLPALVSTLPTPAGGAVAVVQVITGLLLVGYLVLLFRPASTRYFTAVSGRS
ncbi:hypothetical protein LQ327_05165 [Actinomycetospora endophytica]|uniref:Uncharacterized protein n=1 Tax=Actinomycetospora endophytica TaxID=2291215 RepID=A0ABS8P5U7_9PSEU|nr:hypothetical protein [Actinomycetospora endophytica]MCD2192776.1 hypothetical protein [Actinomycetospora endophytica]